MPVRSAFFARAVHGSAVEFGAGQFGHRSKCRSEAELERPLAVIPYMQGSLAIVALEGEIYPSFRQRNITDCETIPIRRQMRFHRNAPVERIHLKAEQPTQQR